MTVTALAYEKATEGSAVVRGKLYPKEGSIDVAADFGAILNQSFVQTFLVHLNATYNLSEVWGFGLDISLGLNSDKPERECIENFYNDPPPVTPGDPCGPPGSVPEGGNYGPGYVPIREINSIVVGNAVWTPVYGKQLVLLSRVIHFDLYLNFGAGLVMSTYYPKQDILSNGRPARGRIQEGSTADASGIGCPVNDTTCYGEGGRPTAQSENPPVLSLGIGQRFHISEMVSIRAELRNLTLFGVESGFENIFTLWGGVGLRF